jgi:hypothetical protein
MLDMFIALAVFQLPILPLPPLLNWVAPKNMAKKLVRVMTPKPPICISMIMMNNPSDVNVEETSTETNPVTQIEPRNHC